MVRLSALMAPVLILFAALLAPVDAAAQASTIEDDPSLEDEARSLFEAGRAAYDAARYESALNYFEQAYEIVPRPALLFNMGAAADRLQMSERALDLYRRYLEALPAAPNRPAVERRITFLEGVLANRAPEPVASPEEAAATVADTGETPTDRAPSGGGDVTGEWWFWTLIALLVVGAGVGITVGVVASSGQLEQPLPGDFPATMALRLE